MIDARIPPKLVALGAFGYIGKHVISRTQSVSSRHRLGAFYLLCLSLLVLRNLHKPMRPVFVATVLADALIFIQAALHEDGRNADDALVAEGMELNGKSVHVGKRRQRIDETCALLRLDVETFGECMSWLYVEDLAKAAVCSSSMMERCLEAFARSKDLGVQVLKKARGEALSMGDVRLYGLQNRCR